MNLDDVHVPAALTTALSLTALVLLVIFGHERAGVAAGAIGICLQAPTDHDHAGGRSGCDVTHPANGEGCAEARQVARDLTLTNHEVARLAREMADGAQERAAFKESIFSELLNVKRDMTDAVKVAIRPSVSERRWRRFWRIAQPALVAAFLEALHWLGNANVGHLFGQGGGFH